MTDREAMKMALNALEFSLPAIEDFGSKEQLTDCHKAIMALYKSLAQPDETETLKRCLFQMQEAAKALAQPEQASNEPPDYVEPPTSDYHNGWEEGFEAAKNLFKKESAPQNADPRLLLARKDNCTALAQPEQEPVAWMVRDQADGCRYPSALKNPVGSINGESQPLYTAPPKREWVGLTQEERDELLNGSTRIPSRLIDWVEQKLKEKNT